VNVSLRGSRDALARLQSDDVRAFVDVTGLGTGQYPMTVHADVKREAGVTRIEPSVVQVRISRGQ
jgi:YbbR domain-containing protein